MKKGYVVKASINFAQYEISARPSDVLTFDDEQGNATLWRNSEIIITMESRAIGINAMAARGWIVEIPANEVVVPTPAVVEPVILPPVVAPEPIIPASVVSTPVVAEVEVTEPVVESIEPTEQVNTEVNAQVTTEAPKKGRRSKKQEDTSV